MLYTVGIYCRLSKDDGNSVHENLSIQSQMDITTAYVQSNGWVVFDYYVDDGFSGVNFERPSFKRMIEDQAC